MADIYSFGIVLLELVTGRSAGSEGSAAVDLKNWAWNKFSVENPATAVADPETSMRHSFVQREILLLLQFGLECTGVLTMDSSLTWTM